MKPHEYRRSSIKASFLLIALAAVLAVWLAGCSPRFGCPDMSKVKKNKRVAWIECKETGTICIFNSKGKLILICKEKI